MKGKSQEHLTGLLERAKDTGLLTHLGATWFSIHPALPWFLRQLFARHYDGQAGRSTTHAALRAWVEAVSALGDYYNRQFNEGNRRVINLLELEETNFLRARRLARRNQWWSSVISCMQGLRILYHYQGRTAEWARLVEEICSIYCTDNDEPIPNREDEYSLVMGYRVRLAWLHERDLAKAAALQGRVVEFNRQRAASLLPLFADGSLEDKQRNQLRTLAVSVFTLGQVLMEQGDAECVQHYLETVSYSRRIADKQAEAVSEFNLGHAYKDLAAVRDLDAAEVAYQRSLNLHNPTDTLGCSKCIHQIGMVHHERFSEARQRNEPTETLLRHAQAAEAHYLEALRLCPMDALTDLAPTHNQLGNLYLEVGQLDDARKHFEQGAQYYGRASAHFNAGETRLNMAVMYANAAEREGQPSQRRANLLRARAYAEAALRDFQQYQGRAAADEADTKGLLDLIDQDLAKLT